jgi:hypothetical protein
MAALTLYGTFSYPKEISICKHPKRGIKTAEMRPTRAFAGDRISVKMFLSRPGNSTPGTGSSGIIGGSGATRT